jgi:hypothetical protein
MIVAKLIGGLGNQMFQYAAGRALAHRYQVPLKLDKSFLEKDAAGAYTQRHFELGIFNLQPEFVTNLERDAYLKNANNKLYRELYRRVPFFFTRKYIAENTSAYMPNFTKWGPDAYLDGFWQSEKYFSEIKDTLRKEFTFKDEIDRVNAPLAERMSNENSISLHVRRADYVNDSTINHTHGTCSKEYYLHALELLSKTVSNAELFVFSDDVNWCRENFSFKIPATFIDHNQGKQSFADMRLMSCCRYNIIANSSFSWWGAWLNNYPGKKVIAPKKWFRSKAAPDIYPDDWIVI